MNTGFLVVKAGIHATLQDTGRFGFQHLGVTTGGALDAASALWANRLLDNAPECAVIEITAGGTELEVQTQTMIAVTGGDLNLTVNGRPQAPWRSFWVRQGDRLKFGYPRYGFRAYVAVQSGFNVPSVLGSVSTVKRERLGGLHGEGSPLADGDFLPCKHLAKEGLARQIPEQYLPDCQGDLVLDLIPGYQQQSFSKQAWSQVWNQSFELSTDSDSMGARLKGDAIEVPAGQLWSEGIAYGAVQVPGDGQPIILLTQRQTLGGYPKLGTILPLSGYALAQRQPGTKLRFRPMTLTSAQQQMRRFLRFFGL
ncbi:MAG: biotin-dependent carboxyltransferase [Idiomarina sp.]|nr:biotin-dependent carboxyltransferase [Idiomarina sp.]